jgi:hypothetical protein
MRRANEALAELTVSPCPLHAFGTAIVNHCDTDELCYLVCIGANQKMKTGNPSLHGNLPICSSATCFSPVTIGEWHITGEIAATTNCTEILTDPNGQFRLTPSKA